MIIIFKKIDINSKKELERYLELVDYEACEYCFTTLYMWQHVYNTEYYIGDDFAVIIGEYEGDRFSVMPLASKENIKKAIDFIIDYFKHTDNKIYLRAITKEVVQFLKENYKNEFKYIEEREFFDYVYDGESLRTLAGRKNQKKRNHLNYFIKEYNNRYEYKKLGKDDFNDCIELLEKWKENKEVQQGLEEGSDEEFISIKKIFDNYEELENKVKVCGVYVDEKLEAFSIGEYLNSNMALIHIEKANQDIRGLYQYINQKFLVEEFPKVDCVNREEDLGIEGLRKAKMSYHPIRFVEKYTVISN